MEIQVKFKDFYGLGLSFKQAVLDVLQEGDVEAFIELPDKDATQYSSIAEVLADAFVETRIATREEEEKQAKALVQKLRPSLISIAKTLDPNIQEE